MAGPSYHARTHRPSGSDPIWPVYCIKVISDSDTLATGDGQFIHVVRADEAISGLSLIAVSAAVSTVSSSGAPTVQIRNITQGHDMLSTACSIDASEYTSDTAATPAVISVANAVVTTGDAIAVDVDTAGTGAMGLMVTLTFGKTV